MGGIGGYLAQIGDRALGIGELGLPPEGDGICTIVHIETRACAAILTALARVLARRSSLPCRNLPTADRTLATRGGGAAGPGQDPE